MTTLPIPEASPMVLVDCPLCDEPIAFDPASDELDCPHCAVRLPVATDALAPAPGLPAAA